MPRQPLQKRFEIEVPARSPSGPSPSREETFSFTLPEGIRVVRNGNDFGARVAQVNFGGLTERRRDFQSVENGVGLIWKLSNGEVFPVTGRSAFIDVELVGETSQPMELSDKYRKLRGRFFDDFFFDGLVAEFVDPSMPGGKVKFADQTIYLGQALLAMATEAAILRSIGGDTANTTMRLKTMLDAINALDESAEDYFDAPAALNGFFVRDSISGAGDGRLGGRFAQCDSDWQFPERENASPSGDQIFGMLFGLSAVVHYSGDATLAGQAREISSRLYDYARRHHFTLRLPSGAETRRGSDMRWLSSLLHGLNMDTTGQDLFGESEIEVLGHRMPLTSVAAFWDDPVTARQVADLAGRSFRIPVINTDVELNSFALHLMLMALAPGDVWSQSELEAVAMKVQHHLSVLTYCLRHPGRLPVAFNHAEVQAILDACPNTGPSASLPPASGWNKDNRWIRSAHLGDASSGGSELYNGIDWLIMHNLAQLVFVGAGA